jgi:hypothetical protein
MRVDQQLLLAGAPRQTRLLGLLGASLCLLLLLAAGSRFTGWTER